MMGTLRSPRLHTDPSHRLPHIVLIATVKWLSPTSCCFIWNSISWTRHSSPSHHLFQNNGFWWKQLIKWRYQHPQSPTWTQEEPRPSPSKPGHLQGGIGSLKEAASPKGCQHHKEVGLLFGFFGPEQHSQILLGQYFFPYSPFPNKAWLLWPSFCTGSQPQGDY